MMCYAIRFDRRDDQPCHGVAMRDAAEVALEISLTIGGATLCATDHQCGFAIILTTLAVMAIIAFTCLSRDLI